MLGLDEKSLRGIDAPTRRDVIYAIIGAIVGLILLPVQVSRLYNGFVKGQLLISGDWYVREASSPVGFALALIMHVALAFFAVGLLWYAVATVRHWLLER